MRLLPWLFACALVVSGCRTVPATQVLVFFHASPTLRAAASSIEVRVYDATNLTPIFVQGEPLPASDVGALARVPLIPAGGDANRPFRIEGVLLDAGGVTLATVSASAGYAPDELRELHLWFDDACAGVSCGEGRTCEAGLCVGACFQAEAPGALRSEARCNECEVCAGGSCAPRETGAACGCDGDTCRMGRCENAAPVESLLLGSEHTCAQVRERGFFCWGGDGRGMTATMATATPTLVLDGTALTGDAGWDHTCVVDFTGRRTCFGWNGSGQIGDGDVLASVVEPTSFSDPPLASLDAGRFFTCGIARSDGRVLCWGGNAWGENGMGVDVDVPTPTERTATGERFEQVAAGGFHACARRADGRVLCWGLNLSGEVGEGSTEDRVFTPTEAGCVDGVCRDDWESIGLGDFHSCGIRAGGSLYCWGGNMNGQLGLPSADPMEPNEPRPLGPLPGGPYRAVAGGTSHTCAIATDGLLRCWGRNDHGQVGTGSTEQVASPTLVALPARSTVRLLGVGAEHSCAIRTDETLWCWGLNDVGQLGLGPGVTDEIVTAPRRVCIPRP